MADTDGSTDREGGCLCGAVRFTARGVGAVSACHCAMCARWSGGPLISAFVSSVEWRGEEHVRTYAASEWASRSFCGLCGSGLLWRMTHEKLRDTMSVPVGVLDDREGLELTREWFYDQKPSLYSLAGDRPTVTEAEAFEMLDEAMAGEG